jgi:predicted AlkP superfamily phosphohydrolase/phosphomutase
MSGRVLLLALEVGDGPLIRRWAAEGHLPTVQRLMVRGRMGDLATPAELLHISPLPSLYTGAEPGSHGIYFTFQPAPGLQGWQRFHQGVYGVSTVWKIASEAGRRTIVFDTPYSHPEPSYRGLQVLEWGTWAQYMKASSVPEGLLAELEGAVGRHPLGLEAHDIGFQALDAADMAGRLVRSLEARGAATKWLMARGPWDLFVTVLDETHPAAHYCWTAPADDSVVAPADQPHLLKVYEALDRCLAEIIAAAGDGTTVVLVSGDAIGANRTGWHLLPEVLARLGLFTLAGTPRLRGDNAEAVPKLKPRLDPVKVLRDVLPQELRKSLARMLPTTLRDKLAKRVDMAAIDWLRTQAHCLVTDLEGCIRVNLKGREPLGIVEPGEAYERVCQAIETALGALLNPRTGRPAITKILRADRDLAGPRRDMLPDLVVHWSREAPITALESPAIGRVEGISPDPRPGTHTGPGFAIVSGPGINAGRLAADAHLIDVAPSILARLRVAAPSHMKGRVWPELVPT